MRSAGRRERSIAWLSRLAVWGCAAFCLAVALLVWNGGGPGLGVAAQLPAGAPATGILAERRSCASHRRVAFARIAAAETAFRDGDLLTVDDALAAAEAAAQRSLACGPANPALWLASARMRALGHGVDQTVSRYLEMSCRTGGHVAFIAAPRHRQFGNLAPALSAEAAACLRHDRDMLARIEAARPSKPRPKPRTAPAT